MSRTLFTAALIFLLCASSALLAQQPDRADRLPGPVERQVARVTQRLIRDLPIAGSPVKRVESRPTSIRSDSLTGSISGIVMGLDASTHHSVRVWAFSTDSTSSDSAFAASNHVKDDGFYAIPNLPAGKYIVAARAEGFETQFFDHVDEAAQATPVEVVPGATTPDIDFDLSPWSAGEGAISGRVVDDATGEPVASARVVAIPGNAGFWWGTAHTDDDGYYVITGLPEGHFLVEARARGYLSQYFDEVDRIHEADPVKVTEPDTTTGVDFSLEVGGLITGVITDESGHPIDGVHVMALPWISGVPGDDWVIDLPGGLEPAVSDEDGRYTLEGLDSGTYVVSATVSMPFYHYQVFYDGVRRFVDATPVSVDRGEMVSNIDMTVVLPEGYGSIAGHVYAADSKPVTRGMVWAFTERDWPWVSDADSGGFFEGPLPSPGFGHPIPLDSDGSYKFSSLPAGEYLIAVETFDRLLPMFVWYPATLSKEQAETVPVAADSTSDGIDIQFPSFDGVITGTVKTPDGVPIPNATVSVTRGRFVSGVRMHATTDSLGTFKLTDLPDGAYQLSAFACSFASCETRWWPDAHRPGGAEPIYIVDGIPSEESVDFVLPLRIGTGAIEGNVADKMGTPLINAFVSAFSADPTVSDRVYGGWAQTDSSGSYAIQQVLEGAYILQATYFSADSVGMEWYEDAETRVDATPVAVDNGEKVSGIDFSVDVRPLFGSIRGTVVNAETGAPLERGYVEAVAPYLDILFRAAPFVAQPGVVIENGTFELEHLYEGDYILAAYAENGHVWYADARRRSGATPVSVKGGEVTEITVRVPVREDTGGQIQGRITSASEEPLEIAIVTGIAVKSNARQHFSTITDPDGTYTVQGLPADGYIVRARAPYHAPRYFEKTFDPSKAIVLDVPENALVSGIDIDLPPIYLASGDAERDFAANQAGGTINGTVMTESGDPVEDALVYVLEGDGQVVTFAASGSDGSYQIDGLIPNGEYRVQVGVPGFEGQYNGGAADFSAAEPVEWSGANAVVHFVLQPAVQTAGENKDVPVEFRLYGNYPNPFNPSTTIRFALQEARPVDIVIYDMLGRQVERVELGLLEVGTHGFRWDSRAANGGELPGGVYVYRISAGDWQDGGQMVLLR